MPQEDKRDYVTKAEFKFFADSVELRFQGIDNKFKEIDRRFDDLTKLIMDIGEHLTKKIELLAERLDRSISQNALEHHRFDARLVELEKKVLGI